MCLTLCLFLQEWNKRAAGSSDSKSTTADKQPEQVLKEDATGATGTTSGMAGIKSKLAMFSANT